MNEQGSVLLPVIILTGVAILTIIISISSIPSYQKEALFTQQQLSTDVLKHKEKELYKKFSKVEIYKILDRLKIYKMATGKVVLGELSAKQKAIYSAFNIKKQVDCSFKF